MKRAVAILVVASGAASGTAFAKSGFTVCKSTYALCTTAACKPIAGDKANVACACEVRTGYSAGHVPCVEAKTTSQGTTVVSRYFPIKSYAQCANDRPWAWCFDKSCEIDKNDPTKATCTCALMKDKGDYVIVTHAYAPSTCSSGLYSSATVTELEDVTHFLEEHPQLKPFKLKLLNPGKLGSAAPDAAP
jgi:hypothetical protein